MTPTADKLCCDSSTESIPRFRDQSTQTTKPNESSEQVSPIPRYCDGSERGSVTVLEFCRGLQISEIPQAVTIINESVAEETVNQLSNLSEEHTANSSEATTDTNENSSKISGQILQKMGQRKDDGQGYVLVFEQNDPIKNSQPPNCRKIKNLENEAKPKKMYSAPVISAQSYDSSYNSDEEPDDVLYHGLNPFDYINLANFNSSYGKYKEEDDDIITPDNKKYEASLNIKEGMLSPVNNDFINDSSSDTNKHTPNTRPKFYAAMRYSDPTDYSSPDNFDSTFNEIDNREIIQSQISTIKSTIEEFVANVCRKTQDALDGITSTSYNGLNTTSQAQGTTSNSAKDIADKVIAKADSAMSSLGVVMKHSWDKMTKFTNHNDNSSQYDKPQTPSNLNNEHIPTSSTYFSALKNKLFSIFRDNSTKNEDTPFSSRTSSEKSYESDTEDS